MTDKKIVFVAFAVEDQRQRDFLKGQTLTTACPFEYIDMSVKEAYDGEWKERVRTRIRRSDGVIALVSENSVTSSGQKWELSCAKEEKRRCLRYGLITKTGPIFQTQIQFLGRGLQ